MTLSAGTRLGPYEILSPLGAGGMGEVYRARDTRLGRVVAVKVLPDRLTEDPEALARFEREAKAVAALSHPNILALHDVGREGRVTYAVMELLEGETLREELASGALAPQRAGGYGVQIAQGLAAAHEKGIVHRDLKPDNLFVTRDDRVKILDFGLAKPGAASPESSSETQSPTVSGYTEPGKVMGTVGYMSPEQVRGLAVDHRSDVFSFGAVFYEMLTGRRAFQCETTAETMTAILKEEPPALAEPDGSVPPSLAPVLRHCLEKKPEKRFQSARDLAFALETYAAPTAATPVPASPPRGSGLWKRLGVAALVVTAAAVGYLFHPGRAASPLPDWGDLTLTTLTTDPGFEGQATFSPDGRTIAYVADRDGNFAIYLQQVAGGPAINLTRDQAANIQPAFSPDGREIAFVSDRAGGTEIFHAAPGMPHAGGDIWVMPTLGGPARRIVADGGFPSWTPDGSGILYVHGGFRRSRIALVPANGGIGRDLPIDDAYVARYFFPRLSRDGRWLLFQNGNQIEVVAASGGKPTMLAEGGYPAWGPGSSVLYTNGEAGKGRTLWIAPFSPSRGRLKGPARPLTFGHGADIQAAASPDGTTVAFTAATETLNLEELPFDAEAGRVLGPPRELTPGNVQVGFLDSSPDGKAVVFSANYGAGSHLWRVDPPAAPMELTRAPGESELYPAWSPDGREIAFSRWSTGPAEASPSFLWIMNADGTTPRRVTETTGPAAWMPDGKTMIVPRGDQLLRLDLATGTMTPVPGANGRMAFLLDRSGRWLLFLAPTDPLSLEVVATSGGTPRVVVDAATEAFHPFFSPSGRWLYIQRNHKNLFRIPGPAMEWRKTAPEKVTEFAGVDLYIEEPMISRDGTTLFYTRGRMTGDIVILRLGKPATGS